MIDTRERHLVGTNELHSRNLPASVASRVGPRQPEAQDQNSEATINAAIEMSDLAQPYSSPPAGIRDAPRHRKTGFPVYMETKQPQAARQQRITDMSACA